MTGVALKPLRGREGEKMANGGQCCREEGLRSPAKGRSRTWGPDYLKTNEETGGLLETLQAEHQSALRPACDVSGGEVEEARMPVPLIPTHMAPLAAQAPALGELAPLMALGCCGCREALGGTQAKGRRARSLEGPSKVTPL